MPERLSTLEASFVALERQGLPMHVAALVILPPAGARGRMTIDELTAFVATRLRRVPMLRKRLALDPFGLSRPEWTTTARLDLSNHIYHHRLASPGRRAQLIDLCGLIHEGRLPRDRPLWQIHLIDGLEGGRQALVVKVHHSMTDGIGSMKLAQALLDRRRHARAIRSGRRNRTLRRETAPGWLEGLGGLAMMAAEGLVVPSGPFNGRVGGERIFGAATLSMEHVRRAKAQLGVSSDDVLLAVVAAGLETYLEQSGRKAPGSMRTMIPASTRSASSGQSRGPQVTSIFVDLPLDSSPVSVRARRISISKAVLRSAHTGFTLSMLTALAGRLPAPLHEAMVRVAGDMPFANLVLSDVPGPDEPQFLLGRPIEACFPMLPLPGRIGVSIAAIRLGGAMGIGVTADPRFLPDPGRLARKIEGAMGSLVAELRHEERVSPAWGLGGRRAA